MQTHPTPAASASTRTAAPPKPAIKRALAKKAVNQLLRSPEVDNPFFWLINWFNDSLKLQAFEQWLKSKECQRHSKNDVLHMSFYYAARALEKQEQFTFKKVQADGHLLLAWQGSTAFRECGA